MVTFQAKAHYYWPLAGTVSRPAEGWSWVGLSGWLHAKMLYSGMVNHLSINQAQHVDAISAITIRPNCHSQPNHHLEVETNVQCCIYYLNGLTTYESCADCAALFLLTQNATVHSKLWTQVKYWVHSVLIWIIISTCLRCFDTVDWAAGRASGP